MDLLDNINPDFQALRFSEGSAWIKYFLHIH